MVRRLLALVVAAALGALLVPGVAAAASRADTTGPTFVLQPFAHFIVPSLVTLPGPQQEQLYQSPAVQKWSASDPSGICEYQLYEDNGRMNPSLLYQGKATSYTFTMGDAGAPGYIYDEFALRVKDCAGNWSSDDHFVWPHDRYIKSFSGINSAATHDQTEATYAGTWSTSKCTCFVDGTTSHATAKGASATFSYYGHVVGWVSETGPTRGSAQIYQDGVLRATVSTYAPSNTGPKVMWANWFAHAGNHTIYVHDRPRGGHPCTSISPRRGRRHGRTSARRRRLLHGGPGPKRGLSE